MAAQREEMKTVVVLFDPEVKEGKQVTMEFQGSPQLGDILPIDADKLPYQITRRTWVQDEKKQTVLVFQAHRLVKKSPIVTPPPPKLITG